jgi:predicted lipid carrier protein YhbT
VNVEPRAGIVLPPAVGALLGRLPAYPGSALLAAALNLALAPHLPADVLARLAQRTFRIHVRDARVTFDFSWSGRAFVPLRPRQPADLVVSATAQDFARLARRQEDPDTLFFSRRLGIEGDTELGLLVKNALDALDAPVFDPRHWPLWRSLARLRAGSGATARDPRDRRP